MMQPLSTVGGHVGYRQVDCHNSRGAVVVDIYPRVDGDVLAVHVANEEGGCWRTKFMSARSADGVRLLKAIS